MGHLMKPKLICIGSQSPVKRFQFEAGFRHLREGPSRLSSTFLTGHHQVLYVRIDQRL